MNRITILFLWLLFVLQPSMHGQDTVAFYVPPSYVETGTNITIPIHINDFNDVDGFQFSMLWDTAALAFDSIVEINLPHLTSGNFGTTKIHEGKLNILWNGDFISGETLPDSSLVFSIQFGVKGGCETQSLFEFTNDPVEILAIQVNGTEIVEVPLAFTPGTFRHYCPLNIDDIIVKDNLCLGDSLGSVSIEISGGVHPYEIIWNTGETGLTLDSIPFGMYDFMLTDSLGNQVGVDSIMVNEAFSIPIDLGQDTTLCNKDGHWLDLNTFLEFEDIQWSMDGQLITSFGDEIFFAEASGTYAVLAIDSTGCSATDTIEVTLIQEVTPLIDVDELTICQGDTVQLNITGGVSYNWLSGTASLSELDSGTPLAFPQSPTAYEVEIENLCSFDTLSILVDVFEISSDAGIDTSLVRGEQINLNATGGDTYEWSLDHQIISDPNLPNPIVAPTESSWFVVNVIDENGCSNMDSVFITVLDEPDEAFKVINTITPNGDNVNDVLYYNGIEEANYSKLIVLNRWGHVLYEKMDYKNDWDGTHKGNPLPAGTYLYTLQLDEIKIKSILTIIRE